MSGRVMHGIKRAENIYHLSRSSGFAELRSPSTPRFLKKRREYIIPIGHRSCCCGSFDGIMEIYVSGNCKFALLASIIDDRIFFSYFVFRRGNVISLSLFEGKKM